MICVRRFWKERAGAEGGGGGAYWERERERVPPSLHKSVRSVRVLMRLETIRKKKKRFSSMLLYVHTDHRTIVDGEPRAVTSTFTQLLSSEEEEKREREKKSIYVVTKQHSSGSATTDWDRSSCFRRVAHFLIDSEIFAYIAIEIVHLFFVGMCQPGYSRLCLKQGEGGIWWKRCIASISGDATGVALRLFHLEGLYPSVTSATRWLSKNQPSPFYQLLWGQFCCSWFMWAVFSRQSDR